MPYHFEQILDFCVFAILVGLFAWIYFRKRELKSGLWLLGWAAMLIHFGAALVGLSVPGWPHQLTIWINRVTLILAGTCFLFSVSAFHALGTRAAWFIGGLSLAASAYVTLLVLKFQNRWVFLALLIFSVASAMVRIFLKNGWKTKFSWFMFAAIVPYTAWASVQIA